MRGTRCAPPGVESRTRRPSKRSKTGQVRASHSEWIYLAQNARPFDSLVVDNPLKRPPHRWNSGPPCVDNRWLNVETSTSCVDTAPNHAHHHLLRSTAQSQHN